MWLFFSLSFLGCGCEQTTYSFHRGITFLNKIFGLLFFHFFLPLVSLRHHFIINMKKRDILYRNKNKHSVHEIHSVMYDLAHYIGHQIRSKVCYAIDADLLLPVET